MGQVIQRCLICREQYGSHDDANITGTVDSHGLCPTFACIVKYYEMTGYSTADARAFATKDLLDEEC